MNAFFVAITASLVAVSLGGELLKLSPDAKAIPGEYVIKLRDGVNVRSFIKSQTLRRNDGQLSALENNVELVYTTVLNGFSAKLDESELKLLISMAEVEIISPNQVINAYQVVQNNADWGIARLSSRAALTSAPYTYRYNQLGGQGSTVYVVDTGIYIEHNEFQGRAVLGQNFITNEAFADGNGHGTHCAGTVGGVTYGVAKNVRLVAVKVLSNAGSGTIAGVIGGIDWSAANRTGNSVISMSLGGSYNLLLNQAADNAIAVGVTTVVAAGNDGASACNYSPASTANAITVGASGINDALTSWSNTGNCVQIVAPGLSITSAWIGSPTATSTISGTSMATPQIAGLAAYLLAAENLASPAAVWNRIDALSISGVLTVPSGTPNKLSQNDVSQ